MSDNQEPIGWNNPETAKAYGKYASEFAMYPETSRDLVDFAQIESGMSVVDLACGTGETTKKVLQQLGDSGLIYAVDMSQAMLDEAKERISDPKVKFIQALAGNFDKVLPEKVDRVISNAAFWQFHLEPAMRAVAAILKPGGQLAFNIPSPFFSFKKSEISGSLVVSLSWMMLYQANKDLGFEPPLKVDQAVYTNQEMIDQACVDNGLVLEAKQIKEYGKTIEESYHWLKIPVMTDYLMPQIPYEQRMEVLEKAYQRMDKSTVVPNQWVYFRVSKPA